MSLSPPNLIPPRAFKFSGDMHSGFLIVTQVCHTGSCPFASPSSALLASERVAVRCPSRRRSPPASCWNFVPVLLRTPCYQGLLLRPSYLPPRVLDTPPVTVYHTRIYESPASPTPRPTPSGCLVPAWRTSSSWYFFWRRCLTF
jgi:hypothetical protein